MVIDGFDVWKLTKYTVIQTFKNNKLNLNFENFSNSSIDTLKFENKKK